MDEPEGNKVYTIQGKVAVTADVLKQQATGIMKKIDNFSTKIKNQRATRNEMLQKIYGAIASMNLTNADKDVKPTNEAELVDAIEFLKTNDSIEKEKLKDLNALYTTIKDTELPGADNVESLTGLSNFITATKKTIDESKEENTAIYKTIQESTLPGADKVEVSDKDSLTNFISATKEEFKTGEEALNNANKTIDGCQTHFNAIENKLSGMGAAIDPTNVSDILGEDMDMDETTQKTTDKKIERERERMHESYQGIITKLQIMVKKVVDVDESKLGFGFYSCKLTNESKIDKKLDAKAYVMRASELIKFQIILKYVLMIMKDKSNAQRAIKDVLKPIETGLKVNIGMTKYEDAIKELLGIKSDTLEQLDKNGKISKTTVFTPPPSPPLLSFEKKCLAIILTKLPNGMSASSLRYPSSKAEMSKLETYIKETIDNYAIDVSITKAADDSDLNANLVEFLISADVLPLLAKKGVDFVNPQSKPDTEDSRKFTAGEIGDKNLMSEIISSKKTGGKTMKKRRNLNKGGKTIRKMLKRTLKRGGNFRKKLTKRK